MPMGSAERRYTPPASLTSDLVNPVAALLAVTVAPGTAEPCSSSTRPEIVPLVPCANADAHVSSTMIAAPNKCLLIHASKISKNNNVRHRTMIDIDHWLQSGHQSLLCSYPDATTC